MECLYYYNETGQIVQNDNLNSLSETELETLGIKRIGTEIELDGYLYDHRADFLAEIDKVDFSYYLPANASVAEVNREISKMNSDGEILSGNPIRFEAKEIWGAIDIETFTTYKNEFKQKEEELIKELEKTSEYKSASESEKEKLRKKTIEKNKDTLEIRMGNEVGNILQKLLQNENYNIVRSKKINNNDFWDSVEKELPIIANEIRKKFPKATFKIEQYVSTDRITEEFKGTLRTLSGRNIITHILGRVDITAIMPDGSVATIELKTSKHKLPKSIYDSSSTTYHPMTLKHYAGQVLSYDIMRKQRGIRSTPYLLNITINPETNKIVGYQMIEVPTEHNLGWYANMIQKALPLDEDVKIESVDTTSSLMAALFGKDVNIGATLETIKRDLDFFMDPNNGFIKPVSESEMSQAYKDGNRWYFENRDDKFNPVKVFAKTQSELRKKVEVHLKALDAKSKNVWMSFGKKFNNCKTREDLKTLLQDLGYTGKGLLNAIEHFWKYTRPGWKLLEDEVLLSNGILIFRSSAGCEVVTLEEVGSIFDYYDFKKREERTTILGNKYSDAQMGSANRDVLPAQKGHLLLIKTMNVLSKHSKLFTNCKILNMSVINARRGEVINTVTNDVIKNNWKYLKAAFTSEDMPIVDHIFENDVKACVIRARDMLELCENSLVAGHKGHHVEVKDVDTWEISQMRPDGITFSYNQLVKLRENLITKFQGYKTQDMDFRVKRAFDEIDKAILTVVGYTITSEKDNPLYGGRGMAFTGGYMTPNYRSPAKLQQTVSEIGNAFHYKMGELIRKYTTPFQIKLSKALEANTKYSEALGGEYVMSEEWFVKDENGHIAKDFRFKMPTDKYFVGREAEREVLEYVLETFAQLRWPNIDYSEYKADPTSDYYKCPLYESGFVEAAITSDEPFKSFLKLLKKKAKRALDVTVSAIHGQDRDITNDGDDILYQESTSNPLRYNSEDRKAKLETYGVGSYTKNIDEIFLYSIIEAIKHEVSKTLLPQIHAVLDLTQSMNLDNNAKMKEIEEALKQWVKTVIYDRSGVKTSLLWAQQLLQLFRQMYSITTLGLNPKNLIRDGLSSSLRSAITILNGKDPKTLGIKADDYFDAFFEMCQNMDSVFTSRGYYNQLNLIHRMANMSYREIADQLKTNKFALGNLDSNFFFITSTSSDYIHRMALLKAYLKKLGADEAYVMINGELKYDMSKDKRWSMLFKYRTGDKFSASDRADITSKEEREKWDEQWIAYSESVRAYQKSDPGFELGREFELALDPDQERSILSLSHNMYGAYTKDEQALVHQTLLGGAFFQFKTYGISRMMDWYRSPSQIAIIINDFLRDENGEILYEVLNSNEEVEKTGEYSKIIPDSKVSLEDKASNKAAPIRIQKGAIDEGRVQTVYALAVAAATNDPDLDYRMQDPATRANVLRAMLDILTSMMIMGFIKIVYPEEKLTNMNDQDWWTRWSYAVMTGVAQDGPIWEVFNSVWGGGEIPVVRGVSRWITSAMGVIHGNDFLPALVNSFGATRELSGALKNL